VRQDFAGSFFSVLGFFYHLLIVLFLFASFASIHDTLLRFCNHISITSSSCSKRVKKLGWGFSVESFSGRFPEGSSILVIVLIYNTQCKI